MTERQTRSRTAQWLVAGALGALVLAVLVACNSRRRNAGDSASAAADTGLPPAAAPDTGTTAPAGSTAAGAMTADSTSAGSGKAGTGGTRAPAPARGARTGETRAGAAADSAARDSIARRDSARLEREKHRIRTEPRHPVTPASSSLVKPKSDTSQ